MDFEAKAFVESRLAGHTSEQVAEAFNRAFGGYLVPMHFTPQAYERRMRGENLDPYASYVYTQGGEPAGIIFLARRGWTARIAAMAVAPTFRRQGLGRRMLERVIGEARERGDRRVILEVIEHNHAALQLYQNCGFRIHRRLVGFTLPKTDGAMRGSGRLSEIDLYDAAKRIWRDEPQDWPWNLAPPTLIALTPPARAFSLDDSAVAILGDIGPETVRLSALFVAAARRRAGHGSRLLGALLAAYPSRSWLFAPFIPEGLADAWFLKNGWARYPICQLEMEIRL